MTSDSKQPYILVVDNNNLLRKELVNYCEQQGCKVQDYEDVHLAIDSCASENYDVIVTDYDFKELKGQNLLDAFKSTGANFPIICLSSNYDPADAKSAIRHGAFSYLKKPVKNKELIKIVKSAISDKDDNKKIVNFIDECKCEYRFKTKNTPKLDLDEIVLYSILKHLNFSTSEKLKLKLVFQEAVTNAIEHGNLELESIWKDNFNSDGIDEFSIKKKERLVDPNYNDREVAIKIGYDSAFLYMEITDEGKGYKATKSKKVSKDELKMHGRGLNLICSCMDEVEILDNGRRLIMKKAR